MDQPSTLEPPPAATAWSLTSGKRLVLAATALLLVLFARRPDAFYRPQFWAEDFIFLILAEKFGLSTFTWPQSGYLHLLPRSIAWPATFLDPALQPPFFLLGSLAVTLGVALSCLSLRLPLPFKPLLALAVVLVPHTGEVFFNPTNVQWIACLGLLLTALKSDPRTLGEWAVDCFFVIFGGLSGPFAIFALPLFVRRIWQRRTKATWILAIAVAAAAATQTWFIGHAPADQEFSGPFSGFNLAANLAFRWPDNVFFGILLQPQAGKLVAILAGGAALAVILAAIWQTGRTGDAQARRLRSDLVWLFVFVVCLLASTTVRKRFDVWGFGDLHNGDRYFFIAKVVLLWIAIAACGSIAGSWLKWTVAALLICGLLANLPRFRFAPYHDFEWYKLCPAIRADQELMIRINPAWTFKYRRGSDDSVGPL